MKIETCQYVPASDVFKDCPKAWSIFIDSDPDCSWGNNNRTLVTKEVILLAIENYWYDEDEENEDGRGTVADRLESLDESVYVDLEN